MKKNILILLSLITFTAMAQTKGKFEVLDLKSFKLHVYYTNDALNACKLHRRGQKRTHYFGTTFI